MLTISAMVYETITGWVWNPRKPKVDSTPVSTPKGQSPYKPVSTPAPVPTPKGQSPYKPVSTPAPVPKFPKGQNSYKSKLD
jgi:hypothetical protein